MTSGMAQYQQLAQMRVQSSPLPELDGKPTRIDAKRNNAQRPPLDVVDEQLSARSIKHHLFAINIGMVCDPVLPYADCPRKCKSERAACKEYNEDVDPYHPQQTSMNFDSFIAFLFAVACNSSRTKPSQVGGLRLRSHFFRGDIVIRIIDAYQALKLILQEECKKQQPYAKGINDEPDHFDNHAK